MTGNTNKKSIANCFCLIKYQEKLDKKYHVLSAMRILNCSTKLIHLSMGIADKTWYSTSYQSMQG